MFSPLPASPAVVAAAPAAPLPPPPPPRSLLCRWEEVLLADTLRLSLEPAVARAKRVLHMEELEQELRGEERQGGWYECAFFVFVFVNPGVVSWVRSP